MFDALPGVETGCTTGRAFAVLDVIGWHPVNQLDDGGAADGVRADYAWTLRHRRLLDAALT